jgi:polygalacturonase
MGNFYTAVVSLFLLFTLSAKAEEPAFVLKLASGNLKAIKTSSYYHVSMDLKNPVSLQLIPNIAIQTVEISPKNNPIPFHLTDNRINFRLEKPGYHLIRINDSIKVFIFAEKPEMVPNGAQVINIVEKYSVDSTGRNCETEKIQLALNEISGSEKILFFPRGNYKSGQLKIRSNSQVYLERGAVLNADTSTIDTYRSSGAVKTKRFLDMDGVENVHLFGYGSVNGNGRVLRAKFGDEARMRLILATNSKNLIIEGLRLIDPGSWNTQVLLCENVVLRSIKLLNDIHLSNTDGFDPDGSRRMSIEHCFAYCGDDNVAIKTTGYAGDPGNVEDISVKGCLFLTRKSALKIGTETRGEWMKNITFEDNNVVESDRGMAIYVSDGALIENITFRNNHFEYNFPDAQQKAIHFVVSKRNIDSKLGKVKHLLLQNNFFENPFPKKSVVKYEGDEIGIDMTVDNLVISGKKVHTPESAGIQTTNAKISFK